MPSMIPTAAAAGWTLPASRPRAITAQAILLIAAAWLLPTAAHLSGLPVRQLLPMHWPAILAGLCYGWRSGLLVGAGAPLVSYLIAGMPRPAVIPAMTVELAAYGCIAGLMIDVLRRGRVEATLASLLGGRLLFVAVMVLTGAVVGPLGDYLRAAMVPGLAAAVVQALVLPPLATWWVRREQSRG
ncbi:MAG: ECF transporter S component [Acidobacteria bacterium]|nr:ECF transporter S component [Acidobacteriota bacterium]